MENKKQKILIIEDEAILQKALQEILLQENYEVVSALDGELGFKMAFSEAPDIILLDLIMPKMDGFEVLEALKKEWVKFEAQKSKFDEEKDSIIKEREALSEEQKSLENERKKLENSRNNDINQD